MQRRVVSLGIAAESANSCTKYSTNVSCQGMAETPIQVQLSCELLQAYSLYRTVACLREETIVVDAISLTDLESTFLHPSDYGALPFPVCCTDR